jgi:serine/threonine protein kinase
MSMEVGNDETCDSRTNTATPFCTKPTSPCSTENTVNATCQLALCGNAVKLAWSDVDVGDLVGSGSFASVYRVKVHNADVIQATIEQSNNPNRDLTSAVEDLLAERNGPSITYRFSSRHSHNSTTVTPSTTFALKRLNAIVLARNTRIAFQGMRFEAQLLAQLLPPHPHIVRLYGMSHDLFDRPEEGFLILEYLHETLEERLLKWRNLKAMEKESMTVIGSCQRFFDRRRGIGPEQGFRIKTIGLGIADALQFLHEHQILYRDLKPANVGFDDAGRVKIFDFDLSRSLQGAHDSAHQCTRRLTPCIGSLRYMSRECALGLPYGLPSDVHSFCILLWEICILQRPFHNVNNTPQLVKVAFIGSERPSLRKIASSEIKTLLQNGWSPSPEARPSAADVVQHILRSLSVKGRKRTK